MSAIRSGPVVASEIAATSKRAGVAIDVESSRKVPLSLDVMATPKGRKVVVEMAQPVEGAVYQAFDVALPSGAVVHIATGRYGSWASFRDADGNYVGTLGVDADGKAYRR